MAARTRARPARASIPFGFSSCAVSRVAGRGFSPQLPRGVVGINHDLFRRQHAESEWHGSVDGRIETRAELAACRRQPSGDGNRKAFLLHEDLFVGPEDYRRAKVKGDAIAGLELRLLHVDR